MIVIPMAGDSRRFREAGYARPKYELPVGRQSLFALTVLSFEHYFPSERFVFVCRSDLGAEGFVQMECGRLGIRWADVVALPAATRGQAETVLIGLERSGYEPAESLLIFNIDTIRPGYRFPAECEFADGYLEVFSGSGDHWSFVEPAASFTRRVARTTEKERISDLCSTGLYHFARCSDFAAACTHALSNVDAYRERWTEVYVAPLYNQLIAKGKVVAYHQVAAEQIGFSGTPSEYEELLRRGT
ncbi:hypothetical protein [Ramlibacter tataouinensis]|uniref:Capsular biosynthesis protein n=1 Tax=Ramlibacter tataouinensis (strain ATCC BAA-407 / DSM 14655 / LMG 21543 / TTB310) TaxID=365046 RepID=F5XYX9_RAMTT|nr:hypothetical protein [Ramlibacter tataouinensis]AEG91967.1 Conserved hypothetical protein [Ramlibacter tataouinensis TTB310]